MPKGPQGQKRPTRWLSALAVFSPVLFITGAALVDWAVKLRSPVWGAAELLVLAALFVWRRGYVRRVQNT